jgi:hypothetical protein
LDKLGGFHGKCGRDDGACERLQRRVGNENQGVARKLFLGFVGVGEGADERSGGPPLALGDASLFPSQVFPPFGGSGQRILADVGHLIARPAYPRMVFVAMPDRVGHLTAQSCLRTSSPSAASRWIA